ncbi:VOC family protein [Kibdelosporangium phytohabitans]|uniref:Glyoxalase n=1 Tax=Kibdelosporangium phytohabitans TaxID=860235 RepID=A0A0N9I3V8_9PSEU|nr:VOC family protein [Kibdelosporangium phytohabitans]ALG08996.1 glyoxalase [Kibdelosporangium phytohabitans]MBE1469827.1 putative enzyme related to lactoylglutathione lyase [Kibdelosporangium phytohabitans]
MSRTLTTVVIDSATPAALAEFYHTVTGWDILSSGDDYAALTGGPVGLAFQYVAGYRAAGWPDAAEHVHLDFEVDDVDKAVGELVNAGATKPDFQPGGADWTVLRDPEGHVFCLVPRESA